MSKSQPEITYSQDGEFYYIGTGDVMKGQWPRFWLGCARLSREKAEKFKEAILDGAVWYESNTGGESYGRRQLPFNFWKVKSGKVERISRTSDLYKDYREAQEMHPK